MDFHKGDEIILIEPHNVPRSEPGLFVIPAGASGEVRADVGGDTVRVTVAWDRWPYIKTIDIPRAKLRLANHQGIEPT